MSQTTAEDAAEKVLALLDDVCQPEEMSKSDYLTTLELLSQSIEERLGAVKEEIEAEEAEEAS